MTLHFAQLIIGNQLCSLEMVCLSKNFARRVCTAQIPLMHHHPELHSGRKVPGHIFTYYFFSDEPKFEFFLLKNIIKKLCCNTGLPAER